ncbi:hypothetical protein IJ162_00305 [Candidatus Saccharibacteria bacterium]|nr:hypothetical protein [Candidatus Saccharibacteria bacterium]
MKRGQKILIIILFLILAAFSCFRYYYYATHGEEFFPSVIKHFLRPPEESPEVVEVDLSTRLTVNPAYDGTNKEFIDDDIRDEDAVVRIHQTKTYQYYDNNGNAIETVETQSYNANSEMLFSGYRRGSKKMPDTSVTRQEIEIVYRYEEDKIIREYTVNSYNETNLLNTDAQSSTKNRTKS